MHEDLDYLIIPEQQELHPDHRSGFVAVIGRPNVGKSTLLNRILEQKIAITSPKPQTTRDQLLGIYTAEKAQIIFLDTPGIHKPQNKLGEHMMSVVEDTISDADIVLWLVDVSSFPKRADRHIGELLQRINESRHIQKIVVGFNKIDQWKETAESGTLEERCASFMQLVDWMPHQTLSSIQFSALKGEGADELVEHIRNELPLGPQYYPPDQVTDLQIRFIAEEIIREKALDLLDQEVPHSIAVMIDEFLEPDEENDVTYISANIYVERDSQKGIVLGRGGSMIKQIGQAARPEIEEMVESQVFLELWVKVWEKWRKKSNLLQRLGYADE